MYVIFVLVLSLIASYSRQDQRKSGDTAQQTAYEYGNASSNMLVTEQNSRPSSQATSSNKQNETDTESKSWMSHSEWVMAILTFIYVCATIFYAVTSHQTLKAIGRTATLTEKLAEHAAEQLCVAKNSVNALHQQIGQMRSANEQTNRLIEQSTASAEAASKSADAFVESERAWIHARLRHESGDTYYLEIANYGRTLAHIIDIRFGVNCIVPYSELNEPYGDRTGQGINLLILPNTGFHNVRTFNEFPVIFDSDWIAIMLGTKQGIFFLTVNYKDVIGEKHASDFIYSYRIPTQRFEDMKERRKYT